MEKELKITQKVDGSRSYFIVTRTLDNKMDDIDGGQIDSNIRFRKESEDFSKLRT